MRSDAPVRGPGGPPLAYRLSYLLGSAGYTIPFFLIALYWINFYNPPAHDDLPILLPRGPIFLGISILSVIIVLARLADIVVDPLIARLSDRSQNRRGRRLPMMEKSFLPAAACMLLVFLPPQAGVGVINVVWVTVLLILGVTFFSAYVTPFLAHMDVLCRDEDDRISLSMYQGLGESLGVILAGQAPLIWSVAQYGGLDVLTSRQMSFFVLCSLAALLMLFPILALRGTEAGIHVPSETSVGQLVRRVLSSRDFAVFLVVYCIFIACVEMVQAGAYYYVVVLLELDSSMLSIFIAIMVPSSMLTAPVAANAARRFGKRRVILGVFLILAVLLALISELGHYPIGAAIQAGIIFFLGGIPLGGMTILVMAVVTEQIQRARNIYGEAPEAIFVAGKNLSYKIGIAVGAGLFASVALLGKDRGHDVGIRLSAIVALGLCLLAAVLFAWFYGRGRPDPEEL
ncbi:MAG: MFS transporter [Spirochaetales bacterium]|nr:MFS transporter [Leptospiraceae bacterium]MCP5481488.1 MFS transporter [Spirochaetales bacterium]MCP5484317.1 MFS transporter [Spirochaetales bacterium]